MSNVFYFSHGATKRVVVGNRGAKALLVIERVRGDSWKGVRGVRPIITEEHERVTATDGMREMYANSIGAGTPKTKAPKAAKAKSTKSKPLKGDQVKAAADAASSAEARVAKVMASMPAPPTIDEEPEGEPDPVEDQGISLADAIALTDGDDEEPEGDDALDHAVGIDEVSPEELLESHAAMQSDE